MNVRKGKKPSGAGGACLALCLVVLSVGSGWAATTPIYKCLDKNLGLLYTDAPCKDGEPLSIRAGDPDPAAVARLEHERDALDQSAAQRMADDRRNAVLVERATGMGYGATDGRGSYDYGPAYVVGYGLVSHRLMHNHPIRPRHPKSDHMRHFAPHPPFIVPRR